MATNVITANDPVVNALPVPGGGTIASVSAAELARCGVAAGVPGMSHENGKQANSDAYAQFVAKGKAAAGEAWHAEWLAQHGDK